MENASKALLIAGGVLIVMVLIGFMLIVKHNVDNFYASEDELKAISDKTKFNEQFTRYNRDDVEGYELITLSNKIIDYNERLSEATTTGNDSQAEPIKIAITLWIKNNTDSKKEAATLLSYDNVLRLFENKPILIEQNTSLNLNNKSGTKESDLSKVLKEVQGIESSQPKINILTKRISSIFVTLDYDKGKVVESDSNREKIISAINIMNSILGYDAYPISSGQNFSDLYTQYAKFAGNSKRIPIYKYYEYTQFTKAKFKCTKMEYSQTTGRVNNLEFMFTGEIE